jgi:general secretion pathway protein M
MKQVNLWFQSLKPRERIVFMAGAAFVVLVAVYTLALAPFYRSIDAAEERVARKQGDLAYMSSIVGEVQMLNASQPSNVPVASDESLVVLIDRAARECGLSEALTGQTPNGDQGIRVRLEAAAFDSVVACMANLERGHGVRIETAQFDRTAKPGLVNASLVFNRTPG